LNADRRTVAKGDPNGPKIPQAGWRASREARIAIAGSPLFRDALMGQSVTIDRLNALVGSEIGRSDWLLIGQPMIDAFAEVTGDKQFIHVDADAAARTALGSTVAHGFLILALLSQFADQALRPLAEQTIALNYGFDRIRFVCPVRTGKRIRGLFQLADVSRRADQSILVRYAVRVEIEGEERPALIADWLTLAVLS
jgi:acyl dehydratase